MRRRLLVLLALAVVAAVAGVIAFSSASFSSTSTVQATATVGTTSDWLCLYSSTTDPTVADRAGYAHQQNKATLPFVATGQDDSLAIDWGSYPDSNKNYTFNRSFTLRTPTVFPNGVSQVTVTVSYATGSGETEQPIISAAINTVGQAGGSSSVTLGVNQKRQVNVTLRARKRWDAGDTYHPVITLTLTYTGGPAAYYTYDVGTTLTVQ